MTQQTNEQIELANAIDRAINIETDKFMRKDMQDMTQCGEPLPVDAALGVYVIESRRTVQRCLEQSN